MYGKTSFILTVFLGILLVSCTDSSQNNRVVGVKNHMNNNGISTGNNTILHLTELPIVLDSSNYIVFPIKMILASNDVSRFSYSKGGGYNNYIENLIFQNIYTGKTHSLTDKDIHVVSYEPLYSTTKEAEKIIIYQVIDSFPKDETKLAITHLYLGTNDGKLFKKISKPNHHVSDWKYLPKLKKVFFRTIEDTDKNNKLTNTDTHAIFSVSIDDFKVTEILN
jgi:hypothetical protein